MKIHRFVREQLLGGSLGEVFTFEEMPNGVLMRDEVRYALPLGPLGALAHVVAVRATLGRIFDYRYDVLARQFPIPGRAAPPTGPPPSR